VVHLLVCADGANVFCGSLHTLENNKDTLVVASKEIGLEANADKTSTWSCPEIRMQGEIRV